MKASLGRKVLIIFMCFILLPSMVFASNSKSVESENGITKELLKEMEKELKKLEVHERDEYLAKFRDEHTEY